LSGSIPLPLPTVNRVFAMANADFSPSEWSFGDLLEQVRLRPSMFLGSTDFRGYVDYLLSTFDLMLRGGATWIDFEFGESILVTSDAAIAVNLAREAFRQDKVFQFPRQTRTQLGIWPSVNGVCLFALSESCRIDLQDGETRAELIFHRGELISYEQSNSKTDTPECQFEFVPDWDIFTDRACPIESIRSRTRLLAGFHPGITFRVRSESGMTEFRFDDGLLEVFRQLTVFSPSLHEPVVIDEFDPERDLRVRAVFGTRYRSGTELTSFVNRRRTVDGGTHERGFTDTLRWFRKRFHADADQRESIVIGIRALLAIDSPNVMFEGAVKNRVITPAYRERARTLTRRGIETWLADRPEEFKLPHTIPGETFPDPLW